MPAIKPIDIVGQNTNFASCQIPNITKLIGGQGLNNSMLAAAGTNPYVDSPPEDKWIEILFASTYLISSGGVTSCAIFICPESSRAIPNLPLPAGNGGGPIVNNVGINFIGSSIPIDTIPPVKGFPASSVRSFMLPPGFFLRAAELVAASDTAGVMHLVYLWRYCE